MARTFRSQGMKRVVQYHNERTGKAISKEKAKQIGFGRGRAYKTVYVIEPKKTGRKKVSVARIREKKLTPPRPSVQELEHLMKKKLTPHQKELLEKLQIASQNDLRLLQKGSPQIEEYIEWLQKHGYLEDEESDEEVENEE